MYEKVSTKLNFVDREQKVLDFWKENQVFEKSVEETKDLPTYTFYDRTLQQQMVSHISAMCLHELSRI